MQADAISEVPCPSHAGSGTARLGQIQHIRAQVLGNSRCPGYLGGLVGPRQLTASDGAAVQLNSTQETPLEFVQPTDAVCF